ncbi:bifunctional diaminohydroxyphosphoribosylaminopyrimidine deaminase/5-amino-6-(5-phosphoribosylamino)uracil reductase RibD [Zobellella endophytica]|uniref:Riboflavin biosynthesis protein RibD n=1 Tax=Zobellella endophytica TaxID=2116700 RepID=A0A2P7R3K2_9GAMM|nr:bifunctional diaminohydroxyphosphoribosylaminopyrimidine deaminase/5-amino-6-(5-phosphoribosylamino)uracil reductase RibD [Zobellella endophytica]PSJ44775.1 bifunctional diaminohydroxyphosphoribosylaminopyrimidine deaminase/5-amino-6-(5-phosphoribosylamino)uracil reductase RibD [Zobellella endophytica]
MFTKEDASWMARALELARRGHFTTSPNPAVGCVLVRQNEVVGEGYHQKAGEPHAEVFALRQAGLRARGATAYVTLEPCSHHGRTPPCAQGLIDGGVARVVAAMVDPNPRVAGRGLAMLQEAGIQAEAGLMNEAAEAVNVGFLHRMRTGRPFVTVKLAASLDGRTALANGESKWITGPEARQDVQRQRALSCALLSGSDTVLADDATLNVRWPELPASVREHYPEAALRQPLRIVVDTRNRLHPGLRLFSVPGPVLLLRGQMTGGFGPWVEECVLPRAGNGKLDLPLLLDELGRRQLNRLWVEAGARLSGALLGQGLVDELVLYQAPRLMGNIARGLFELPELTAMTQVPILEWRDCRRVGADIKLVVKVKD